MTRLTHALLLATFALPATAQTIYKCTDAGGGTLISNTKVDKNCKAVASSPESSMPAPKARSASSGTAANPSPAGFPRIQDDTQKARDTDRRRILEQELAGEQRNLEQARKDFTEQDSIRGGDDKNSPKVQDRLVPYKERVAQHERNIQAVQKELGNLR